MSLWVVRAGAQGEQEEIALKESVIAIGWDELGDLSQIQSYEQLKELFRKVYPEYNEQSVAIQVGEIWRFLYEIKKGDLVAIPLKTQYAVAIGIVEGDYEYRELSPLVHNLRKVKGLKIIPRQVLQQDILYSFSSHLTVYKIQRNEVEERIRKLLEKEITTEEPREVPEQILNIEEYAKDQIIQYIERKFKGHGLARLVAEILKAQGYTVYVSPPGPDGGVDILASAGPLGFDPPRICVQVKSSSSPVDLKVLKELKGTITDVKASQGLLVSWGEFKDTVRREARNDFFNIRLWGAGELLEAIFQHYEKFSDELKAELPLKRIWTLVLEAE